MSGRYEVRSNPHIQSVSGIRNTYAPNGWVIDYGEIGAHLLAELNALLDRAEKAEARVAELEAQVAAWSPARCYGEEEPDYVEVHEHHVAVYGGTRIPVAKCPECGVESFVEDGLSACCDAPIEDAVAGVRRYTRGGHRGKPNYKFQRAQLDLQKHRCFWCDRSFGDPYMRAGRGKGGIKFLRVAWDHVIPIAVDGTNHEDNFVASCNVCNGFKGAKIFANETAMRAWLKARWLAKMIPDGEVDREV